MNGSLFSGTDEMQLPDVSGDAEEAAARIAEWLNGMLPGAVMERLPVAIQAAVAPANDDLRAVLLWWKRMHDEGLVSHGVNVDKPAKELRDAWKAFGKNATARECLADLDRVRREIQMSSFCRGGWFRLEKLLRGATNSAKVPICRVLMDGGYRDDKSHEDPRGNGSAASEYVSRFG